VSGIQFDRHELDSGSGSCDGRLLESVEKGHLGGYNESAGFFEGEPRAPIKLWMVNPTPRSRGEFCRSWLAADKVKVGWRPPSPGSDVFRGLPDRPQRVKVAERLHSDFLEELAPRAVLKRLSGVGGTLRDGPSGNVAITRKRGSGVT
jgi:hypothetical protein